MPLHGLWLSVTIRGVVWCDVMRCRCCRWLRDSRSRSGMPWRCGRGTSAPTRAPFAATASTSPASSTRYGPHVIHVNSFRFDNQGISSAQPFLPCQLYTANPQPAFSDFWRANSLEIPSACVRQICTCLMCFWKPFTLITPGFPISALYGTFLPGMRWDEMG